MKRTFTRFSLAALLPALAPAMLFGADLAPAGLRCEYTVNPMGVDVPHPRLFWVDLGHERGQKQSAYEILTSSSAQKLANDQGDLWDSGKVPSDETIQIPYAGRPLKSSEQVFWKVRVWDHAGRASGWSKPAAWTMGLLHEDGWQARWIAAPTNCETLLLRRDFTVRPGLKRAFAFVCGLGQYEMSLDGKKAADDFLSPGWTDYRKTCLYDTRDVTPLLRRGANTVGLFLGNGMYRVERVPGRYTKFKGWFGPLKAIAQIRLEYTDGTVETIGTDNRWRAAPGPITFSSIYGGEDFDARLVQRGWNEPGFNDAQWPAAQVMAGPGGQLKGLSCAAPPIREFQIHRPVANHNLADGDVVYDLGQNAAHVLKISVTGPPGSRVRLFPAELTNADGSVNQGSMGAGHRGRVWCEYTKGSGAEETWAAKFFYVGCRYVQAHFIPAEPGGKLPVLKSLEGIVVHSASPPVGRFECSNTLFNRIYRLVRWAQMNNMMSLMTDCPHRERLGWLEEDHLNGPSLRYDFDLARLFTKQMNDMADAQLPDGLVPDIAPEYTVFGGGFRDSPEWGSACVIVPWQQYEFDADLDLLRRHYPTMKRYLAYLAGTSTNGVVNHGLGDWYDLGPKAPGLAQLTPVALTATAFYYYDTHVLARVAALLGKTDDARRFEARAARIRAAFNQAFFNPTNLDYATGSQTANAIPLVMGLVAPSNRVPVLDAIVRDVRAHGNALTSGDVGYRYLLRALADYGRHFRLDLGFDRSGRYFMRLLPERGRSEVIFAMNNQSDKPGYGCQLKMGATSLTEAWNARRGSSQDHFMLGQIQEWFYHDLAGIGCDPAGPGFKKIIIRPQPVGDLDWVKASYQSIRGEIVSDWKIRAGRFSLRVTIPPNTTATVYIPAESVNTITESGRPAAQSGRVKFLRKTGGGAAFDVASGRYRFESKL
ncbi:MAG: family 78 glycoside hydrolase catalytic domain [Verrucomicrobiota bacterium]|nr:family 78 glycoside hydrolase catalytic domain [Verrucomicrobiota bacterium]